VRFIETDPEFRMPEPENFVSTVTRRGIDMMQHVLSSLHEHVRFNSLFYDETSPFWPSVRRAYHTLVEDCFRGYRAFPTPTRARALFNNLYSLLRYYWPFAHPGDPLSSDPFENFRTHLYFRWMYLFCDGTEREDVGILEQLRRIFESERLTKAEKVRLLRPYYDWVWTTLDHLTSASNPIRLFVVECTQLLEAELHARHAKVSGLVECLKLVEVIP